jgi:hypothetical protein
MSICHAPLLNLLRRWLTMFLRYHCCFHKVNNQLYYISFSLLFVISLMTCLHDASLYDFFFFFCEWCSLYNFFFVNDESFWLKSCIEWDPRLRTGRTPHRYVKAWYLLPKGCLTHLFLEHKLVNLQRFCASGRNLPSFSRLWLNAPSSSYILPTRLKRVMQTWAFLHAPTAYEV